MFDNPLSLNELYSIEELYSLNELYSLKELYSLDKLYSLDELFLRVQDVDQFVCVDFLGRCEQDDLKHLRHSLQEFPEMGASSDKHLSSINKFL